MEKIKELSGEAVGGLFRIEVGIEGSKYVSILTGQRIPLTPIKPPGKPAPIMEDKDFGSEQFEGETEAEAIDKARSWVEQEVGHIITLKEQGASSE